MKEYKVKYWDNEKKAMESLFYPYLETALMVAEKICHKIHDKVFVTDGTLDGTYLIEGKE